MRQTEDRSRVRFGFVPEISLSGEIPFSFLRDRVVFALPGKDTYQIRLFELWQATSNGLVGNRDVSILEIVSNSLEIEPSTGVIQEFEYHIVTPCHPFCSVPGHASNPEEPSKTLFGVLYFVAFSVHNVQSFSQILSSVGNHLDTTIDTALFGTLHLEKVGCDTVYQHGRRVDHQLRMIVCRPGVKTTPETATARRQTTES